MAATAPRSGEHWFRSRRRRQTTCSPGRARRSPTARSSSASHRTATRRSFRDRSGPYDAATGRLLWTHKTIPDGFVGAGDWYDAAVDTSGNVYVSTGSTYRSGRATAHPNTTAGFEQYSLFKLNGTTGAADLESARTAVRERPRTTPRARSSSTGGGVALVGASNKDGWFRAYRQDNGSRGVAGIRRHTERRWWKFVALGRRLEQQRPVRHGKRYPYRWSVDP